MIRIGAMAAIAAAVAVTGFLSFRAGAGREGEPAGDRCARGPGAIETIARLREQGQRAVASSKRMAAVGSQPARAPETEQQAAGAALTDPVAALAEARRLPPDARLSAAGDIGGRWAMSDPEAAYRFASRLPVDPFRYALMNAIFARWSTTEPARVVQILDSGVSPEERHSIIQYGIARMARIAPDAAFAQVFAMHNGAAREEALEPLLQVWASNDPYAAVAALEQIDGPSVSRFATIVGPLFARSAPEPALDWAIGFDGGYGKTWRSVMGEIARRDIGRALLLARGTPPERQKEALVLVVGAGAQADPIAATRTLRELPPELQAAGTRNIVGEWIKRDARAAEQWLLGQPRGPARDSGLVVLARDPNMAANRLASILNAIDSDRGRVSTALAVLRVWFQDDPAAADELLAQLYLPSDGYTQIRQQLDRLRHPNVRSDGGRLVVF